MRYLIVGFSLFVLIVPWRGADAQINFPLLTRAESLDCFFLSKTFGYWNGEQVYASVVETTSESEIPIHLDIVSINQMEETAIFQSEWGDEEVSILNSSRGLTFIHMGSNGNLRVLTVYPYFDPSRRTFSSVLSEHAGWLGSGLPSQAYGFCSVR
jgi:hypothetical protein